MITLTHIISLSYFAKFSRGGIDERRQLANLRHEQLFRHRHRRRSLPRLPQRPRGEPEQIQQQITQ